MGEIKASFTYDKETKSTHRYAEIGDNPKIGTIYIKKSSFENGKAPEKVSVLIEY